MQWVIFSSKLASTLQHKTGVWEVVPVCCHLFSSSLVRIKVSSENYCLPKATLVASAALYNDCLFLCATDPSFHFPFC